MFCPLEYSFLMGKPLEQHLATGLCQRFSCLPPMLGCVSCHFFCSQSSVFVFDYRTLQSKVQSTGPSLLLAFKYVESSDRLPHLYALTLSIIYSQKCFSKVFVQTFQPCDPLPLGTLNMLGRKSHMHVRDGRRGHMSCHFPYQRSSGIFDRQGSTFHLRPNVALNSLLV